MASTWMLKKKQGGLVLWQKMGGDPPGVVVDNDVYKQIFSVYFADVKIVWGPGDFEMVLISDGATYRVGPVTSYVLPKSATAEPETQTFSREATKASNRAKPQEMSVEAMSAARIIHGDTEQAEANRVLGPHGLGPGLTLEDGIPQPKDKAPSFESELGSFVDKLPEPKTTPDLPPGAQGGQVLTLKGGSSVWITPESAAFRLLVRNVQKRVMLRNEEWADRLRILPELALRMFANAEFAGRKAFSPLNGVYYKGWEAKTSTLDPENFTIDDDAKVHFYLSVWEEYQNLERYVREAQEEETTKTIHQDALCSALLLLLNATALYLMETGWTPSTTLPPFGDEAVREQMQAVAEFVASKDKEYGQPIRRHGLPGLQVRLYDKLARYTNLKAMGDSHIQFESVADSAKDLIGYSLIVAGALHEIVDEHYYLAKAEG